MTKENVLGWIGAGCFMLTLGAAGAGCVSLGRMFYDDHQLLNQIRRNNEQQLINAAEQVKQFQQQQAGQGAAPAK